jgi:glycolate oxidase FAD binding subunit
LNPIAALLSSQLPERQVVEGFRAEAWSVGDRVPHAVVFPEDEYEVAQILSMASAEEWECVPSGKGTWLGSGHPPGSVDVVISTTRMYRVLAYEPDDLFITAEAGIGLDLLSRRVLDGRQWLPLDPPGAMHGSLGATVGTGSAGPLEAAFGTPRDHVLGVTLVTGDGRLLRLGGKVVKNVAGFDLLKLVLGSWGTLGVITSVTTRLHPVPEVDRTLLFQCDDVLSAAVLARAVAGSPVSLAAVEVLAPGNREEGDRNTKPLVAVRILESPEAAAVVDGLVCERADTAPIARMEGHDSNAIFANVRALEDGAELVLRLSMLPSRLADLMEKALALQHIADPDVGWGTRMAAHAQTGVLRVMMARVHRQQGWLEDAVGALANIRLSLESEGGSMVISQGPSEIVQSMGAWGDTGSAMGLMRALQKEFDPASILTPGRLIS